MVRRHIPRPATNTKERFYECFETASQHVAKRIFAIRNLGAIIDIRSFFNFSLYDMGVSIGYNRCHVWHMEHGRAISPDAIAGYRRVIGWAVERALGEKFSVRFRGSSLRCEIVRACPTCGKLHAVDSRGDSAYCGRHRK